MPEWIRIVVKIAKKRILKAIEIDTVCVQLMLDTAWLHLFVSLSLVLFFCLQVVEVTNQVPYSSSAVDAHTTFQQVCHHSISKCHLFLCALDRMHK